MQTLLLGDYVNFKYKQELIDDIASEFLIYKKDIKSFQFLIAYKKNSDDYGSIFLLLKKDNELYQLQAERWGTDTFADQFEIEKCNKDDIKSEHFYLCVADEYVDQILNYIYTNI